MFLRGVARMVWDHEAQSSNLCTPTKEKPLLSMTKVVFQLNKSLQDLLNIILTGL